MRLTKQWRCLLLIALLGFGVGVRFQNLEKYSLWSDELFSLAIVKYHNFLPVADQPLYRRSSLDRLVENDTFWTAKSADQSPPLNELLQKVTVNWFGASEFAARLPAVLTACALLFWFAGFAWRHPDPYVRRVLRWSLLLLVFYPILVVYANEGRAYSIGVSLLGMATLLWMLRWRDGWRAWQPPGWIEIGLFTLACYAHYNAALLVAMVLALDAVTAAKRRSGQAVGRLMVLGCVFLLWLSLSFHSILSTSKGDVTWRQGSSWDFVLMALNDSLAALHLPWLGLASTVLLGLVVIRKWQGESLWPTVDVLRLGTLAGLTLLYVVLAGKVAATAGMGHPRHFIFVVPLVAVMMGLVFAQIRHGWSAFAVAAILIASSGPSARLTNASVPEDFRGMTLSGAQGTDKDTLFVYPWVPNRDLYRLYLEHVLGEDMRSRMIGISSAQDVPVICAQIKGHSHVVVLSHESGKSLIDALYGACGESWPERNRKQFQMTFSEHWKTR